MSQEFKLKPLTALTKKKIKQLEAKMEDNRIKQMVLHNTNNDLQDKINLLSNYTEENETTGRGKSKKTELVGRRRWREGFRDEDTGEVIYINRSEVCRVDGQPANRFGELLEYYTIPEKKKRK